MCPTNVSELVMNMFLLRATILGIATHICTLLLIDQTTKNSIKCIRFDFLVWIIGSSDALLLLCTISAHLIKHLVQVSLNLVNSVAGISNRFLFVIIEQLLWSWRNLKLKKIVVEKLWSWRNLKFKKFAVEEIWSGRNLKSKKFEVEEI